MDSDSWERKARRMVAAGSFGQGELRDSQIAGLLEVSTRAVTKWHKAYREGGRDALLSSGPPGVPGLLDAGQCLRLRQILRRGAKAYGFAIDNWTLKRVRRVIAEQFGVEYTSFSGVWRLLARIGFSPQRPARTAIERDEGEIAAWVEHHLARCRKGGRAWGLDRLRRRVGITADRAHHPHLGAGRADPDPAGGQPALLRP